ncbi:MAG: guanylate kinase [Spirochaeta sp.]|nr:guanylate kinase [Spirochaeta sp.]RPG03310.1 MAG: guanylate kinase [Proteobacteria bacterium TMED72]
MAGRVGIPFVLAAPSGTGKTTVCQAALARDSNLDFSISHTTRSPRKGEENGRDYHFVSPAEFRRLVEEGAFVEHAEYNAENYGTSHEALRVPLIDRGRDVLLEIEVQGAAQVRERRPDARFIFLLPPSMTELERRLRSRGTDGADAIDRRLAMADRELEAIRFFDYAVVNEVLDEAVSAVLEIIEAERGAEPAALERIRARYDRASVFALWQEQAALA